MKKLFRVVTLDINNITHVQYIVSKSTTEALSLLGNKEFPYEAAVTRIEYVGTCIDGIYETNQTAPTQLQIYCKIGADSFPREPWWNLLRNSKKLPPSDEVVKFLLSDAQQVVTEDEKILRGDKVIWYLCCNEKFGFVTYSNFGIHWNSGYSSPDLISEWVRRMYNNNYLNSSQCMSLLSECQFVRDRFNVHYDIFDHIQNKEK